MSRRAVPCLVAIACYLGACSSVAQERSDRAAQPNILFLYIDDLGWKDVGFMGSDFYETPHLDALARRGMIFTSAYSCAANCAPARACLLSGQYTPRHEIFNVGTGRRGDRRFGRLWHVPGVKVLRPDIVTWPNRLQDTGYATATIGKWHLSEDPRPYGFDVNIGGNLRGGPPGGYFAPYKGAPGLENASDGEYLTDRLTNEALSFIDNHRDRAWCLYLTHFAVHTPLEAPDGLKQKYKAKRKDEHHQSPVLAAMTESVDTGVGRIVAKLEALGLTERTIIIFSSDNGGFGPATSMNPLKGYKGTYYEGGIRVPQFVVWPHVVKAGSKTDVPVTGVDWYPTLCEMAGVELPDQPMDGLSLVPLLRGKGELRRRAIYWHFPAYLESYTGRWDEQRDPLYRTRPCSVIRYGKWKLHAYYEDDSYELYDLDVDIGEQYNLVDVATQEAARLQTMLAVWRQLVDAPIPSAENPHFDPAAEAAELARRNAAGPNRRQTKQPESVPP